MVIVCLLIFASGAMVGGYDRGKKNRSGISRNMEQAIRLYEAGQDNAAMDRFMDILMKGTPSEKALANEYISKITLRMNAGGLNYPGARGEEEAGISDIHKEEEVSGSKQQADEEYYKVPLGERVPGPKISPQSRKVARIKIREKIKEIRQGVLLKLNDKKGVKIYMQKEMPQAVSLDARTLFGKGTAFNEKAPQLLSLLAGLIFSMGRSHCLILPEGSIEGDVKIMNIRRALALNSYLIERGVSAARLDVNLIGSDINLPGNLRNIKGMILLFNHNLVPKLQPPEKSDKNKPQISMGIYPTSIRTYKNEGAIVEFAVYETLYAQPTWRFQIFQVRDKKTMFLIQEISQTGAAYRQTFWNGRKDFFGEAYPPGQYIFSLTAKDAQGRESVIRKLILIKPKPGSETRKLKVSQTTIKKRKSSPVKGAGKWAKYSKQGTRNSPRTLKKVVKNKSLPSKKSPKTQRKKETFTSHVTYKIYFRSGARSITDSSEKKLLQVADNMNFYPMSKIKIIGYAYSGEPNSNVLAQERVNFIITRLSAKYGIEKSRIKADTAVSEVPINMVEIKMLGQR